LIFLEENIGEKVTIQESGAFHRARWISKIIYCLKIYMFRSQFELKPEVLEGLKTFSVFIVKVYIKYWFTSSNAASAPTNDLKAYENKTIAKITLDCFSRNLWNMSPTLIGLSFFDNNVSYKNKLSMISALSNVGSDEGKAKKLKVRAVELAVKKSLDLVTNQTILLFETLNIKKNFLRTDPSAWETNKEFLSRKKTVESLKVVNDIAERGVSLISSFNSVLTNQEEQKQFLLQVVEKHH